MRALLKRLILWALADGVTVQPSDIAADLDRQASELKQ